MADASPTDGVNARSAGRIALAACIGTVRNWLTANELADAHTDLRLQGLLANVGGDSAIPEHRALAGPGLALTAAPVPALIPIEDSFVRTEIESVVAAARSRLETRRRSILDQLQELEYLRGKNRGMVAVMMEKLGVEKERLERTLSSYQALRSVFSRHTNRLFTHLGMDAVSEDWQIARQQMRSSAFTSGVRSAMSRFLRDVRERLERSSEQAAEIAGLMAAMYRKFSEEHGLRLPSPPAFSMLKYLKEIDRLEAIYERRLNTLSAMLANDKATLMHEFFEMLAKRVSRCYEYANREADQWLGAIMAPMELQVNEHQTQFMRRLESIKRVHRAIHTLEERMEELLAVERSIRAQIEALAELSSGLEAAMASAQIPLDRAA